MAEIQNSPHGRDKWDRGRFTSPPNRKYAALFAVFTTPSLLAVAGGSLSHLPAFPVPRARPHRPVAGGAELQANPEAGRPQGGAVGQVPEAGPGHREHRRTRRGAGTGPGVKSGFVRCAPAPLCYSGHRTTASAGGRTEKEESSWTLLENSQAGLCDNRPEPGGPPEGGAPGLRGEAGGDPGGLLTGTWTPTRPSPAPGRLRGVDKSGQPEAIPSTGAAGRPGRIWPESCPPSPGRPSARTRDHLRHPGGPCSASGPAWSQGTRWPSWSPTTSPTGSWWSFRRQAGPRRMDYFGAQDRGRPGWTWRSWSGPSRAGAKLFLFSTPKLNPTE